MTTNDAAVMGLYTITLSPGPSSLLATTLVV